MSVSAGEIYDLGESEDDGEGFGVKLSPCLGPKTRPNQDRA